MSHKKSLLKNKVLPSFLYNSGKQSSALYASTVHVNSNTSLAEPRTTESRGTAANGRTRSWLRTQTRMAVSEQTLSLRQQLRQKRCYHLLWHRLSHSHLSWSYLGKTGNKCFPSLRHLRGGQRWPTALGSCPAVPGRPPASGLGTQDRTP